MYSLDSLLFYFYRLLCFFFFWRVVGKAVLGLELLFPVLTTGILLLFLPCWINLGLNSLSPSGQCKRNTHLGAEVYLELIHIFLIENCHPLRRWNWTFFFSFLFIIHMCIQGLGHFSQALDCLSDNGLYVILEEWKRSWKITLTTVNYLRNEIIYSFLKVSKEETSETSPFWNILYLIHISKCTTSLFLLLIMTLIFKYS
jgi:hypothetical protein